MATHLLASPSARSEAQRASCSPRCSAPALSFGASLGSGRPLLTRRQRAGRGPRVVTSAGLFGLGVPELVVIGGVVALVFGPKKLPELGKELGKTVKSFQTAAEEFKTELKNATEDEVKEAKEAAAEAKK